MYNYKNGLMQPQQQMITRDADPLTAGSPTGLYNQLLFDLCSDDAVISLSLANAYNPALNAIGFIDSDVYRIQENFLSYIGADGTGADSATSGVATDPCAPANSIESGGCAFVLEGWTRLRRSSPVRDMTDTGERYCETQPIYTIGGERIDNDQMWDLTQMATVIIRDMHRQVILGDAGEDAQTDGLINLIQSTYTDPVLQSSCKEMAGHVVDWNGQTMCLTDGQTGATYNGNAIPDGYQMIDVIKAYVRMARGRIQMSSIAGAPKHIALIPMNMMQSLIDCYVCYTVCGSDITRMDSFEARTMNERLQSEVGIFGAVNLMFDGVPIAFFPWDFGLYDEVAGTGQIIFLVPDVGNTPIVRIQIKNMQSVLAQQFFANGNYQATDLGRWLWWENRDNTCYQMHVENQHRVYMRAPWLQMRITNIAHGNVGPENFSMDPQSARFLTPSGADYNTYS